MTQQEIERLATFAKEIIRLAWYDGRGDGGDIQSVAERLGLIVPTAYDPEQHGEHVEADPGDRIYILADWLKATDSP